MPIEEFIGFPYDDVGFTAEWGSQRLSKTLLLKMESPFEDEMAVQAGLPAYDGGITPEPTFTIGRSYWPGRADLILKSCDGIRPDKAGRPFWLVELTYETAQWINQPLAGEDQGRGRTGQKKRLSGATNIKYPWDEPPTWSGGQETVSITTFHHANGTILRHANKLPLTEGISTEIQLEQHTFTWNVEYDNFTYATDIRPYVGKLNDNTCFSKAAKHVLLKSCTAVENYRTVNIPLSSGESPTGATETHHFITLTAVFLIDNRASNVHGYWREANRRVSMHTMQLVMIGVLSLPTYMPIAINSRGDNAKAPWPLTPAGLGYPYATLPTANPLTDFAIIDPELPELADLDLFVSTNGLVIP
jgi:hypothetical protein